MTIEEAMALGWEFSYDKVNSCWWACKGEDSIHGKYQSDLIKEIVKRQ